MSTEEKFTKILDAYTDTLPKYCVKCANHKNLGGVHTCVLPVNTSPDLVTGDYPTTIFYCTEQRDPERSKRRSDEFYCGPEGKLYN